MKAIVYAALALLLFAATSPADPRSEFEEGLRLYRANDMAGAIQHWEGVLRRGAVSGPLLYNLGNAYYRTGQVGKAILSYERAVRLMPRDRDVRANLELVRLGTVDRIERPLRLFIWDWVDSIRDALSLGELAVLHYVFGFAALAAYLTVRLAGEKVRRAVRPILLVVVSGYVLAVSWYAWRAALDTRTFAIVTADKTGVCSAPDAASTQLFSLHEGTKVQCGESLSGWVSIRLVDGRKGWVPASDIARI